MLNTWRGLLLAASVTAVPAFAQADCPPRESIDRSAQTARDALVALDGLVPEEQQTTLENRYTAMSILRWSWQGRDAILDEPAALNGISECIESGTCDALESERSGAGPRTIASFPSDRLVNWANRQLECEISVEPSQADETEADEAEVDADLSPDTEIEPLPVESSEVAPDLVTTPDNSADDAFEDELTTDVDTSRERELPEIELESEAEAETESESETDLDAALDEQSLAASPDSDLRASDVILDAPYTPSDAARAPASASILTASSGSRTHLIRTAILLMMRGNVTDSVEAISKACYRAAETSDPVQSCELVFNHYDHLATRADPIAFLAFTDQLCRLNYRRGCVSLATYFGVETTAEAQGAALRFYDRACNSGDAEACAAASDYFLTGRVENADPMRARDTLYRSCDLGRLSACQPLAEFYARGVGGDIDLVRALELNDVSCSNAQVKSAETCVAAADFVLLNLEEGAERDQKVRTYAARACQIGHDVGCAWHADNLEFGIGGAVDQAGSEAARDRACQLGHAASCEAAS